MGWVIGAVIVQVVIAAVIVYVLKRMLERDLLEAAMEKLQAVPMIAGVGPVKVMTVSVLDPQVQGRIKSLIQRKSKDMTIDFIQESGIKGGIVIEFPGGVIDCSLANRLKNL